MQVVFALKSAETDNMSKSAGKRNRGVSAFRRKGVLIRYGSNQMLRREIGSVLQRNSAVEGNRTERLLFCWSKSLVNFLKK